MKKVLTCLALAFVASGASAVTITFSGFPAGNVPVTTYLEAGFTVTRLSGSLTSTSGNGNGAPSIFSNDAGSFSVTNGSLFNFVSFQGANGAFSGTAAYTVTGSLGGTQLFSNNFSTSGNGFATFASASSATVDTIRFDLTGPSTNVDNIVVNAVVPTPPVVPVPEPATWAIMMVGMGAIGFTLRGRRR